jgi:hypothetical protein
MFKFRKSCFWVIFSQTHLVTLHLGWFARLATLYGRDRSGK